MRILAVDTSTRTGSVAILDGDILVAELQLTSLETHAKRLMCAIDTLLGMAGMGIGECDGFAVSIGPGSFTGLRIGISAIKGLAFALGKPVAGVSTLDALAFQFPWFPNQVCPLLDARKGEVYTALYKPDGTGGWEKLVSDCVVEPGPWLGQIQDVCLFVGDGTLVYRKLIEETRGSRARFAPPSFNTVRASVVGALGLKQIASLQTEDVGLLVPQYIRRSDAEIKLEQRAVS
jgi:tRNA threonylcarbamoyladenosine biosynthesis protein TsaB